VEFSDKTVLILGGSGLVGRAIAKRLLPRRPARIVLVALGEQEVRDALEELRGMAGETEIVGDWGNVFLPRDAAKRNRDDLLGDPVLRDLVIGDLLGKFTPDILQRSFLFHLLDEFRPEAVVDCINTATAFAYQDIFTSARELLAKARSGTLGVDQVERHILTLTMPQLIRHVQIAVEAMRLTRTGAYIKIGTSGTGGMGLNIPYTHSEERPSSTLLTKSAVAGAHSLLLFLMARTPDAPAAFEIKPTAAIAWRRIAYGPIVRSGRAVARYDCPNAQSINDAFNETASGWTDLGGPLESVFIDVGENGVFSRDEFDTVTSLGQMEFITPEEVADYVVMELEGHTTGKDIIAALDSATAGPTYNAGVMRSVALERLDALERRHGVRSVAFEMLGPPRLTKMLYESFILSKLCTSVRDLAVNSAHELSTRAEDLLKQDQELRSAIISVGLPIILKGDRVYRGPTVLLPPDDSGLDELVDRGWVDVRPARCERWVGRAQQMVELAKQRRQGPVDQGSNLEWGAPEPDDPIAPARFAKWVLRYEDQGERIKR
jgi:NAD(P)-dependent dehydrogenase (short-subunit alcohol dehydrogenase family)